MKFNLAQGIYGRFRNAKDQEEGHQHDPKVEDKMNDDHGVVASDTTKVSNDMMQDQMMKKSAVFDSDHHDLDKGMEKEGGGGLKDLDDSHQDKPPTKKWMNRYGTEQDMILD